MRRRQRGSVFVFTVVMVLMTTTLIVAASVLSNSTRTNETRRERDAIAQASFQGVADQIKADSGNAILTLPIVKNYTAGGYTWSVTASDNSSSVPRSVLIAASASIDGKTYSEKSVVIQRFGGSSPVNYCLASNTGVTSLSSLTTGSGGSNGDVYINGTLSVSALAASTVNGTLDTTATQALGNLTVTGKETLSDTALTFPTLNAASYQANATTTYASGTILNNVSFPAPSGSTYPIYYLNGSGQLKGTITGNGVIFVNGNLSVPSSLSYANGSSRVAVIVNGNVTITTAATSFVGYWFSSGSISLALGAGTRTVNGALVANSFTVSSPLSVTYDPDVFSYPSEGKKFCLPGFWP